MVLLIRYISIEKSYSTVEDSEDESPKKQSAYGFFNDHPDINEGSKDVQLAELKPVELVTFKEKPHLIDVEGVNDLYGLNNFSREESKALLAWGKMRFLVAAIAWKDLVSFIDKSKASKSQEEKENEDCSYSVTAFNTATLKVGSNLRIPCGLVENSSITVIGIPDATQESFQIELVGSKLPEETKPSIVLNYYVILPGENLTKDPLITQIHGLMNPGGLWWKSALFMALVDGLVKCNAKIFRNNIEEIANTTSRSNTKSADVSNSSAYGTANYPFLEGNPFTATLWAGIEGFHMTVNGRHETSFAYREKLEPWLVSGVNVIGDKNRQVNFELWKEAQAYGDIQLLPFVDYYSLLALKTIAILHYGRASIQPQGKDPNGLLYGGISFESAPHRDKENKWYISPEEYPPSSYPPWAHGPGYIISRDIAKFIVQLFKLEDVAVGIWYVNDDRFYNAGCESDYILAHYQNPRMVLCLWEKLQKRAPTKLLRVIVLQS
ncbi:unnamed protein product [Withania somnifera]